jgi:tetratricopeptide (TPR) repeat protein
MSLAAQPILAGPPSQPTPRRRRLGLFLVPLVALVVLATPGGAFAYASNQVSQGQSLESQGNFAQALAAYESAQTVAGNPVSKLLLGDLAIRAGAGLARTHYAWGQKDAQAGLFEEAQAQFTATIGSGLADWQTTGNDALASLFLSWGNSLSKAKIYRDAIDKYRQVSNYDTPGNLRIKAEAGLATAYAGYAAHYATATPPDYPSALSWYLDLVKLFPLSPEAKQAKAASIPETLYNGGLAYVSSQRYAQARDAMNEIIKNYAASLWATKAIAAMTAPQPLTGRLVTQSGSPVPNRLLRISTKWVIVAPHTYDDYGGQHFSTTTDAAGNFSLVVPPGQNYLVTWWDPSRGTFVTTFVSDTVPVNQITINPLEPDHANVEIA